MTLLSSQITTDEVTVNNRFNLSKFSERVIDITAVGNCINPKVLVRLARSLGAGKNLSSDELLKKLVFHFNSSNSRLKRRRGEDGYVYEKIGE